MFLKFVCNSKGPRIAYILLKKNREEEIGGRVEEEKEEGYTEEETGYMV